MKGHSEFAIKTVGARTIGIAANGLDELFKGRGYFYLVDEGPHADKPEYTQYLFAAWCPATDPDALLSC